jgi:hypothetical protein
MPNVRIGLMSITTNDSSAAAAMSPDAAIVGPSPVSVRCTAPSTPCVRTSE